MRRAAQRAGVLGTAALGKNGDLDRLPSGTMAMVSWAGVLSFVFTRSSGSVMMDVRR